VCDTSVDTLSVVLTQIPEGHVFSFSCGLTGFIFDITDMTGVTDRTVTFVRGSALYASTTVDAWGSDATIDHVRTRGPGEPVGTLAREGVDSVKTCTTVLTRGGRTLVDILFTVIAGETRGTLTSVAVDSIDASTTIDTGSL